MKKKIILTSIFIVIASFLFISLSSMPYAFIIPDDCMQCGDCYNRVGEPFYQDNDGYPWWGPYQTGEQWNIRYYHEPTCDHQIAIMVAKERCPSIDVIFYDDFDC
jgi:ferredoxin